MFGRTPNGPPPLVDPNAFRNAGGNLPPVPPTGPPMPPGPPPGPTPPGPDFGDRMRDMSENMSLRRQIAAKSLGRFALGTRARFNERLEDNQEDRIILGRTAIELLDYEPGDPHTNTPARITGNRNFPDKEGVRNDLRSSLVTERADSERGLGLRNRIKTRVMARRINKGISTHAKAARATQESYHKRARPISPLRPFKGFGQREAHRIIKDGLADGTLNAQEASLRRQFLKRGTHANTDKGVINFQIDLRNANLQTHKGTRFVNRKVRRNRPRMGLSRHTRKIHLGNRYSRLEDRAENRQDNAADRAEALRLRVDDSHRETERLKTQLAHRRGTTYTPPRQFVHGHTINARNR